MEKIAIRLLKLFDDNRDKHKIYLKVTQTRVAFDKVSL